MSYTVTRVDPRSGRGIVIGTASSAAEAERLCVEDQQTLEYEADYSICFTRDKKSEDDLHADKQTEDR